MADRVTVLDKISAIKRMTSQSHGGSILRKQAPFVWPDFRQGAPQWHLINYEAYATEGFSVNQLVYATIMYKVRSLYQLPLMAYSGNSQHPDPLPKENPLSQLCSRPNPHQSFIEFQGLCTVYLNLSGNCYIVLIRDDDGKVVRMYPLRPDRVYIVPLKNTKRDEDDRLIGFVYVKEGRTAWLGMSNAAREEALRKGDAIPIIMEDMIHVKLPNPIDPLEGLGYGLSPLSPGAHPIDIDNKVTEFIKLFFDQGTMFQGLLSFDAPLDPNDIPAIRERWSEIYGGYENWAEIGILDQGGKYSRITPTFQEMGFESIDGRNETRGVMPFGVPPILIGARVGLDRSTYCLPATARVSTPSGPLFIRDIVPGDTVWSISSGVLEPANVTWSGFVGTKLLYEIRTKNRTLLATGNHPLLVRVPGNSDGPNDNRHASTEWKRVDAIQSGDYIVEPRDYPDGDRLESPDGTMLTEDMLQFLGAVIGDGTVDVSHGKIRMAIPPNDRVADKYRSLAMSLFVKVNGSPIVITNRERSFLFSSANEARRLDDWGFGGRAHTKRIPGWIYELPRNMKLSFLAGLIDTDGHIDSRGVMAIGFTSRDLVLDVKDLFISVGMQVSNVYKYVRGPEVLPGPGIQDEYTFYEIVVSSAKMLSEIPFADFLYRERVNDNLDRFKRCGKDAQRAGLSEDLGFYKVVSIETKNVEEVYDITVEDNHCFIADGIVVHNSNYEQAREACWSDTLVPESKLFEVEYQHVLDSEGEFVAYDYWSIPSLRKAIPELARAWANLVASGVPKNFATTVVKLPIPPIADGDVIYMPNQLIPVDDEGNPSRIYPGVQMLEGGQPQPGQEEAGGEGEEGGEGGDGKEGDKEGDFQPFSSPDRLWSEVRAQFVHRLDTEGI